LLSSIVGVLSVFSWTVLTFVPATVEFQKILFVSKKVSHKLADKKTSIGQKTTKDIPDNNISEDWSDGTLPLAITTCRW
jgi:hypothetical protein